MSKTTEKITIGIVEPSPMIGKGLKSILEELSFVDVYSLITDNCQYYIERISSSHPEILIINPSILELKKRGDVDALMHETGCHVIIALATQHTDPEILKKYYNVIDVTDSKERIKTKLRHLLNAERTESEVNLELSSREKEILVSVAKGLMNKEIAYKHNLSIHTVITHRKNITRKTSIKSVSGLTVFAIMNNMIDMQDIE
ncbi:MAG: LuxR C-terminal-related transcriptional regulator [Bacteroidales bacterium]|jgi:DNA-binding NarL/FixJ family response regulator|nr:LuxR C-terminal-related transcriptional regulator [Bacteroidales bacterium]